MNTNQMHQSHNLPKVYTNVHTQWHKNALNNNTLNCHSVLVDKSILSKPFLPYPPSTRFASFTQYPQSCSFHTFDFPFPPGWPILLFCWQPPSCSPPLLLHSTLQHFTIHSSFPQYPYSFPQCHTPCNPSLSIVPLSSPMDPKLCAPSIRLHTDPRLAHLHDGEDSGEESEDAPDHGQRKWPVQVVHLGAVDRKSDHHEHHCNENEAFNDAASIDMFFSN